MPYNGSGGFTRVMNWVADAAAGTKIKADRHDQEDDNLASGLGNVICKDGQSSPTADIPFNGKKITNLAAGIDPTDAVNLSQLTALKTFTTGIILSGSTVNGMVTFGGSTGPTGLSWSAVAPNAAQDVFFGVTGTAGAGQWVWNDKADGTGTNIMALAEASSALTLTNKDAGAGSAPIITLFRDSASPAVNDTLAGITFAGRNSAAVNTTYGYIYTYITDPTNNSEDSTVRLMNMSAGALTARLTLGATGVTVGGTLDVGGTVTSSQTFAANAGVILGNLTNGMLYLRPNGTAAGPTATGQTTISTGGDMTVSGDIAFTGIVGSNALTTNSIKANHQCKNGSTGAYGAQLFNLFWNGTNMVLFADTSSLGQIGASSDYRIKKDVADLPSTWDHVKALRPISYTQAEFHPVMSDETAAAVRELPRDKQAPGPLFASDDIERWGFIAHETQEALLPTSASGEKDMVDGVQGLNLAPIVAALTKALQEAMARIEALEAQP